MATITEIQPSDQVSDSRSVINNNFSTLNTDKAEVAGADTQVQYNDGGNLGGDADFTYDKTTDTLNVFDVSVSGAVRYPSGGTIDSDDTLDIDVSSNLQIQAGGQIFIADSNTESYLSIDGDDVELFATDLLDIESSGNSTLRLHTNDGKYKLFNGSNVAGLLDFSGVASSDKTFTFPNKTGNVTVTSTGVGEQKVIYKSADETVNKSRSG